MRATPRSALFALHLFLVLAAAACGCGDDQGRDGGDAPRDAFGVDTQLPDTTGRRDTARDVGDPGEDTSADTVDTLVDTLIDVGPDDPEWVAMPGLPDGCVIERALHPERLLHLEWLTCGDGCTYLAPDPAARFQRVVDPSVGAHVGGVGYFSIVEARWDEPEADRRRIVVLASETEVFGAWREPPVEDSPTFCIATVTTGEAQAVLHLSLNGPGPARVQQLFFTSVAEIGEATAPTTLLSATILPLGAVLQSPQMSDTLFASELQPSGDLFLLRPTGEHEIQRVVGIAQNVRVVGDDVFFERWENGHTKLMHARFGEGHQVLIEAEGAHIAGTTITEDTITWNYAPSDGRISEADFAELWTSPFTTERDALIPRRVLRLGPDGPRRGWTRGAGGEGFFFARFPFQAFRLSDGAVLTAPRGDLDGPEGLEGFLWASGGEVATAAVLRVGGGTVRRSRLDSFVPWKP